jgi:hypothetical protein
VRETPALEAKTLFEMLMRSTPIGMSPGSCERCNAGCASGERPRARTEP